MAEVSVLNPGNIFNSLAANGTGETAPLARALRAALIDPRTDGPFTEAPTVRNPGLIGDLPAIIARPLELGAENVILLAAQTLESRLDVLLEEVGALQTDIDDALRAGETVSANPAGALLTSLDFAALRGAQTTAAVDSVEGDAAEASAAEISAGAARNPAARLGDFAARPGERAVFGSSFTGLATDSSLRTQFDGRVALTEGQRVSLADLIIPGAETAAGGNNRQFAVALTGALQDDGETAEAAGALVDDAGDPIANGTLVDEADLANIYFEADTNNRALDYLSIVEQRESGGADPNERGRFQTVALSSSPGPYDRIELEEERIRDFTFFTESGTAFSSIDLVFSGVDDEGVTAILDAIEQGYVRVQVTEQLSDGSENQAVVDRRESGADRLQADFAFAAAGAGVETTGLRVEVRALDPAFDISGISVRAVFG